MLSVTRVFAFKSVDFFCSTNNKNGEKTRKGSIDYIYRLESIFFVSLPALQNFNFNLKRLLCIQSNDPKQSLLKVYTIYTTHDIDNVPARFFFLFQTLIIVIVPFVFFHSFL